jgi:general secretion pathway protein C
VYAIAIGLVLVAVGLVATGRGRRASSAEPAPSAARTEPARDEVAAPAPQATAEARTARRANSHASVSLLSTAISRDAARSTATILLDGKARRAVRPGDEVDDGRLVEWVESGRIGLRSDAGRSTLDLTAEPLQRAERQTDVPAEALLRPPAPDADESAAGNRPVLDVYREEPGGVDIVNLLSEANFAFRFDERNGDILGMTLDAISRDSAYAQLGIENGDVLLAVNGIEIDSPEAAESALGEIVENSRLRILLERSERTEEVTVDRIVTEDAQTDDGSS